MHNGCVIARLGGGLGNQLFMYAFGLAMAERNHVPLKVDATGFVRDKTYKRRFLLDYMFRGVVMADRWESRAFPLGHRLKKLERKFNSFLPLEKRRFVQERGLPYDAEIARLEVSKPTMFSGYWQAAEYFDDLCPPIEERVVFAPELVAEVQAEYDAIVSSNAVCLAIRRYEEAPNPGIRILDADYFSRAMARLEKLVAEPHYFVFAQDMEWARQNIKSDHPVTFVREKDSNEGVIQDLYLMTNCRHSIISNSSLHWWAAKLNVHSEDAVVIAPETGWPNPEVLLKSWIPVPLD